MIIHGGTPSKETTLAQVQHLRGKIRWYIRTYVAILHYTAGFWASWP